MLELEMKLHVKMTGYNQTSRGSRTNSKYEQSQAKLYSR